MTERPTPIELILERLHGAEVDFVLVGGQAEYLHGSSRVTFDVDLCDRPTAENAERLASALRDLRPRLRDLPDELPFTLDARSPAFGGTFTLETDVVPLDLLAEVEPLGDFDEVARRAVTFDIGGRRVRVISLEDLIRVRGHLGRPKDAESLRQLRAIRRLQDDTDRRA